MSAASGPFSSRVFPKVHEKYEEVPQDPSAEKASKEDPSGMFSSKPCYKRIRMPPPTVPPTFIKEVILEAPVLSTDLLPGGPCTRCRKIESTQWRLGPAGKRSLCNACGLKYLKHIKAEKDRSYNPDGLQRARVKYLIDN